MGSGQNRNRCAFSFREARLEALPSGGLYWPDESLLIVSDLHLGKCARLSAIGGAALPPYDTIETLSRLEADLELTGARSVICLGDSFDTTAIGAALPEAETLRIAAMQAGRDWIWIEGNHDPGPVGIGGTHLAELTVNALVFRHIAARDWTKDIGEVSGHYHPKARIALKGRAISRPCFLFDATRLILPAYGAYTGGLWASHPSLRRLMTEEAEAILIGATPLRIPLRATCSG